MPQSSPESQARYTKNIVRELSLRRSRDIALKTIYIGGGSPSVLPERTFSSLIDDLGDITGGVTESTVEGNPETLTASFVHTVKRLPGARISLGIQSLDDAVLERIGRQARRADIHRALQLVRDGGINNLSVDFIIGLPGTDDDAVIRDMTSVISDAAPEHISIYMLDLSGRKDLSDRWHDILPDDGETADRYRNAAAFLASAGYRRYELANFAKPGFESKHNQNYWVPGEYIGIGAAAAGYYNGIRYTNAADIKAYNTAIESGVLPPGSSETMDDEKCRTEFIFLSLRTAAGLDVHRYRELFNDDPLKRFAPTLEKYRGCIVLNGNTIALNDNGFLFADEIAAEFMRLL